MTIRGCDAKDLRLRRSLVLSSSEDVVRRLQKGWPAPLTFAHDCPLAVLDFMTGLHSTRVICEKLEVADRLDEI